MSEDRYFTSCLCSLFQWLIKLNLNILTPPPPPVITSWNTNLLSFLHQAPLVLDPSPQWLLIGSGGWLLGSPPKPSLLQPGSPSLSLQGKFSISNHLRGPWFDSDEFILLDWMHPIRSHGLFCPVCLNVPWIGHPLQRVSLPCSRLSYLPQGPGVPQDHSLHYRPKWRRHQVSQTGIPCSQLHELCVFAADRK